MVDPRSEGTEARPLLGVAAAVATAAAVPTTLRVAVTNAAPHPRVLSVAVVGIDAAWTGAPQRTGVLAAGESAVVELEVAPPLGTLPAQYPMVVTAQALDPATGAPISAATGSAETVLVVNPRSQLSLEVKPGVMTLIGARRFAIELRNSGGVAAEVKLTLKSTSHITFKLRRDSIRVRPDQTVVVRASARAKRPSMVGPRSVHSFTVSARGTETVKHVSGQVIQRSLIGPTGVKALFLLLALVVWVGAAVVFIPALAERVQTSSEESAAEQAPGADAEADAEDGGADGGDEAGEDGGGEAGGADGDAGAEGEDADGLQLSGTVAGDSPAGVSVALQPTSLVDEEAQGGTGVGVDDGMLDGTGMRLASALLRSAPERAESERSVKTSEDGSWAFPSVPTPGYYLVSFTKPGFQTQRFVIDSSSAAAAEPLEVDLEAGEGSLSGRITGPNGKPVGGAAITITDGTNTAVTNSNSEGDDIGAWSVEGLSTPSTYVVSATKHDMSSAARVVPLAAGSSGTASLQLVAGVALLTGTVKATGLDGTDRGVGGITITVSDGKGDVRTATTLTQSPRGSYAIPSLSAPGTYSVTASGSGFQPQTKSLVLAPGAAAASLDFDMGASTGHLSGRVVTTDAAGQVVGWPNTGLTLSNPEHTYKTMSTAATVQGVQGASGRYEFSGVAPGDYVLTASYFGKETVHQNVEVKTGPSKSWTITLVDDGSDGLTASSTIEGSVLDAVTQLPVPDDICTLAGSATDCLTATVSQPTVPATTPATSDVYTTTFAPGENYLLPDPDTDAGAALRPGLHTVTLRVPGYEVGTVDVELGVDTAAVAPLAQLFPAPKVTGLVTAGVDGAHPASCVWVVPGNLGTSQLESTLGTCAAAQADQRCRAATVPFLDEDARPDSYCAQSDPDGFYSVQVPSTGDYTIWAQPLDRNYAASDPRFTNLGRGVTETANISLARFGQVELKVLKPGVDDRLVPVDDGTVVHVTGTRRVTTEVTVTGTEGLAVVTGLLPNSSYDVSASTTLKDGTTELVTLEGATANLTAGMNESPEARLRLVKPMRGFTGRVTSTLDDKPAATNSLDNATVEMMVVRDYTDDAPNYPDINTTLKTDARGCFAVRAASTGPNPARRGDCIDAGLGLTDTTWRAGSIAERDIATSRVGYMKVSAPGYVTQEYSAQPFDTSVATPFVLDPAPMTMAASLGYAPADGPGPDWSGVTATVIDGKKPLAAGDITIGLTGSGNTRTLTWSDSKLPANQVLPGSYDIEITTPLDYTPVDATLTCLPAGACSWSVNGTRYDSTLPLQERGTLDVTVYGKTATGTSVLLGERIPVGLTSVDGSTTPPTTTSTSDDTDSSSVATFGRMVPGSVPTPTVRINVPGYKPGVSGTGTLELRCTRPDTNGSTGGAIMIVAGETTSCVATMLQKLGSISGTLIGRMTAENGPDGAQAGAGEYNFEHLGNVTVTLEQCTSAACTAVVPGWSRTRVTSLGSADNPRSGGAFSFDATTSELEPATYLLSVKDAHLPSGYASPTVAALRATVTLGQGEAATKVVNLYARTVNLALSVVDDASRPVPGATVYLHRRDVTSPGTDADPHGVTDAAGAVSFATAVPGWTTVWVSAPGIGAGKRVLILTSRAGGNQSDTVMVTRPRGDASGIVTTVESSSSVALPGATVTLTCPTTGTSGPPSAYCRSGAPAVDILGNPLTRQTDAQGGYSFTEVAVGTYVARYAKRGYGATSQSVQVTAAAGDDVQAPVDLTGVGQQVTVALTSAYTGSDLAAALAGTGGLSVRLVGLDGAPSPGTATVSGSGGTFTATFTNVRWGCYDVTFDQPTSWRGTISGPADPPGSVSTACAGADLVIDPDTSATSTTLAYRLLSGKLPWTFTHSGGFGLPLPAVTLTLTPTDGTPIVVPAATSGGSLFVPPGTYAVTAAVPSADAAYWRIVQPTQVVVADGSAVTPGPSIDFTEELFDVKVTVPSLTGTNEAEIRYSLSSGQSGTAMTVDKTVTLRLPRGNWLIRGAWASGPGRATIDVVAGRTLEVTLTPFSTTNPSTTPSGTPSPTPSSPTTTPSSPTTTPPASSTASPTGTPGDPTATP